MDPDSMREAQDIICRLYRAAHSLACDEPDCPSAHALSEPSGSTNAGSSLHEDALLLALLGIVDNVSECLDLLRILVSGRNNTNRPDHLTQSGTTSHLGREGTAISSHGPLYAPPIPNLYRDQWYEPPAVSPPVYPTFCHGSPRSFPRAPAPSPASEATSSNAGTPTTENRGRLSFIGQGEQQPTATHGAQSFPALSTSDLPAAPSLHHHSPPGSDGSDNDPRSRFAARVGSASEGREGLEDRPDSHLSGDRSRRG